MLQDLAPEKLAVANEESLSAWIPIFGRLGRVCLNDPPGAKRSITNHRLSLLNSVMDARLEASQVDPAIQHILGDARARQVPVLWWIGPSTRPADLGKRLEQHGFALDEESPGMAIDLAALDESLRPPDNLSATLAQDEVVWRQWASALIAGFEVPPTSTYAADDWQSLLRVADPGTVLAYLGWLNGKPVATSILLLAAGVAGIYAVSTIPEARRKGIGAWMTYCPLLQARAKGYRVGVLQASPMGVGVYRSLGFREYCRIETYRWAPDTLAAG